jgi:hypothetical protein
VGSSKDLGDLEFSIGGLREVSEVSGTLAVSWGMLHHPIALSWAWVASGNPKVGVPQ